jgi:hypothetical protein
MGMVPGSRREKHNLWFADTRKTGEILVQGGDRSQQQVQGTSTLGCNAFPIGFPIDPATVVGYTGDKRPERMTHSLNRKGGSK